MRGKKVVRCRGGSVSRRSFPGVAPPAFHRSAATPKATKHHFGSFTGRNCRYNSNIVLSGSASFVTLCAVTVATSPQRPR